ncbi:PREDICTED: uncharacterized protein LOC109332423 isoform X2 [Lupinus angustifolius]|uniref:uncharacterized protein LOC109332423 isoform X2 n=1 Tax=Lupinus angustifolius TaxID=3871 RepID=UPI00092F6111|nr:PREDICTED: uncharacterized protein LOC109332423 isoform X2 [Lupinus angustifolius]
METPSSTRRIITRSQALASSNNIPVSTPSGMIEDFEKNPSKSKEKNNGCALMDITNDSPIAGLANGGNLETPLSSMVKQRGSRMKITPGSGEALLRGQVKNLLQKVEEEVVFSKICLQNRPFLQLMNSSMLLGAPTPANTPQIANFSGGEMGSVTPSTIVQEQLIPQVLNHMFDEKKNEDDSEKSVITRSLLLDFSEKYDDASVWSIQVNASTHNEDFDDDNVEEIAEDDYEEEYYDGDYGGLLLDELCEGLNKVSMNERLGPKFEGKHTRYVYNSDDEIVKEEEVENSSDVGVLCLKGMPTPKGKHLRFSEEE